MFLSHKLIWIGSFEEEEEKNNKNLKDSFF